MNKVTTVQELTKSVAKYKKQGLKVGLVPTMGFLHSGHLSLVKKCKEECDVCVVSIYVNPSQFNESSDFESYPKDLNRDCDLLESVGCDLVWIPEVKEVETIPLDLVYDVQNLDKDLEGKHRKGHFKGVLEVVYRLFKGVHPHASYFGEKDYQQYRVIDSMVKSNALPIDVISVPTMREQDGLAMSSRNVRISKEQRSLAPVLFQTMTKVAEGARSGDVYSLLKDAKISLTDKGFEVEYLDVYSFDAKQERLFAAVKLGEVRLIDNISM